MEFKRLELEDFEKISPFFDNQDYRLCDFSFGALYMWRDLYRTCFAIEDGVLYLEFLNVDDKCNDSCFDKCKVMSYPLFDHEASEDEHIAAIEKLRAYVKNKECDKRGACERLQLGNAPESVLPMLQKRYLDQGVELIIETNRDWADYIYSFDEILELKGRKHSAKRNQIHNFERGYLDGHIEPITNDNIDDVINFYLELDKPFENSIAEKEDHSHKNYCEVNECENIKGKIVEEFSKTVENDNESLMSKMEMRETLNVLKHLDKLKGTAAVLKVGNRIAGFTAGEKVADTLIIHIEKADISYKGAYAKLFHEYVKMNAGQGIKFINREEDLGEEGLRKSKLSYHPLELLSKYRIIFPAL